MNWSVRVGIIEIYTDRVVIVCALVVVMFVGYIMYSVFWRSCVFLWFPGVIFMAFMIGSCEGEM